ncbi:MAG: hypothetical protein FGM46_02030 [Ferruginibacter sp.]|nr:hypothetical protein [Ferruginibacter sp.]
MTRIFQLCFFVFFFCFTKFSLKAQPKLDKEEMRAVWVATVENIDWPAAKGLSPEEQKSSFIDLLDLHKRNGINTMIVQIRPCSDAFYPSPFEPWSEWLTGKQGRAPDPYYDPLDFMINETHKRGMEFHAWLNPYRAVFNIFNSSIASNHISKKHPEWFLTYGDKKYFDPGNKEVHEYVVGIVHDIVSKYDVDAIHFDDYFYPYPIPGKPFPDSKTYRKYGQQMSLDDWRRSNTDSIIYKISTTIRAIKPECQFGISPFGVWRNSDKDPLGSDTKAGPTNYDVLYADILLWLKKSWIDYVTPQIYWEIGHKLAPYEVLIDWWSRNTYGKNCYIGLAPYRAGSNKAWKSPTQLTRQIDKIRSTPNIKGMVFFSSKSLENNLNGWADSLRLNYFKTPAVPPRSR